MRQTVINLDRSATQVRNECVDNYIHDCQKRWHALQNCDPADQESCFQLVSVCVQLSLDIGLSFSPPENRIESARAYLNEHHFHDWAEQAERLMCIRGRTRGNARQQSELLFQSLIDRYYVDREAVFRSEFLAESVKWLNAHLAVFLDCESKLQSYLEWTRQWDWAAGCDFHKTLAICLREAERYQEESELSDVAQISADLADKLVDRLSR